ncbi:6-pyruvoyltetrahydropterin/6-carboxytetrahydropterin synthase [Plasticicumulans lactativorans]|uniref:6-carboxy-5,6,7,8-tetrahydropterin synthase n=1 Tax=Plasticicumulans lactativorans TaxID=1133106 RepID=A0A4R2L7K8_9GAMM|nr:6-carboxytetrahydropterin synthase [Plasticicumulans lactativorans]TCO82626.1 6-pyruvoyltetrahydropterin/6-carboxytetrahydropterin synthase [Plasticicumulans lactativorans]
MSATLYRLASAPFEAACHVGALPEGHRARRLHGHSYLARVRVRHAAADGPCDCAGLAGRLAATVAPLDYAYLNDIVAEPTDENLARWIGARLDLPGVAALGIQSTPLAGVDLDAGGGAHVWRRFRFEAAHRLPHVPPGHPCGRMHGHGFEVILHAQTALGTRDLALDHDHLAALWAPLHAELHHACLNDLPGLANPTSELLAAWIWARLKGVLPELSWVTVYETVSAGCHYDGHHYRIWKEQRFEAALQLTRAAAGDPRRGLHGHSYVVRLHLAAPLDTVMGWTVDYGEVKALFAPLYQQIDHHRLDALPGLDQADPASLAQWLRERLHAALPALDRIDLFETPACGVALCWGGLGPALPG